MARAEEVARTQSTISPGGRLSTVLAFATSDGTLLYGSMMVSHALGFVLFMILARVLTVEEYGEVVTLTAAVYLLAVVVRSVQAQAAQSVSTVEASERGEAYGMLIIRQSLPWTLVGAGLIFGVILLASAWIADYLNLKSPASLVALGAYLAVSFILPVPRGLLLGLGRLRYASFAYVIDPLARIGFGLLLLATPLRTAGVILGYFLGRVAAYLVAVRPFLRADRAGALDAPPPTRRWWLKRAFLFTVVINATLMTLGSIDPFAIKHFFSPTIAGQFSVAFLLGRVIMLSTLAASWVTFSTTVRTNSNDPRSRQSLSRGLLLGGGIAGIITLIYWLAPETVATLLGGQAYEAAGGFVGLVGLEMMLFTLVSIQAYYHIAIRNNKVLLPFALALVIEIVLLAVFHSDPKEVIYVTMTMLGILLVWISVLTVRAVTLQLPEATQSGPTHESAGLATG